MSKTRGVVIVAKLTHACNLACKYCYMQTSRSSGRMSDDILQAIIRKAQAYYSDIEYTWHGGEPMLVKNDVFKQIIDLQHTYSHPKQSITNNIQTNGTLLSAERVEFLNKLGFGIGISYDGVSSAHDSVRLFIDGESSSKRVIKGIENVIKVCGSVGVCIVLTKANIGMPKEMYWNLKELGVGSVNFIPFMNYPRNDDLSVDSLELFTFWKNFMEVYLSDEQSFSIISPLFQYMGGLLGNFETHCVCDSNCLGGVLSVDMHGNIYLCDIVDPGAKLGNILELERIAQVWQSDRFQRFIEANRLFLESSCRKCKWFSVCGAGCRANAFAERGNFSSIDPYCEARKAIIEWLYEKLRVYSV
ncbi:MAG: radical SAM protein [Chloroflexota bacterium]